MVFTYNPEVEHLLVCNINPKKGRKLITINPGVNEVSDEEWEAMKPNFPEKIETGEIKAEYATADGKRVNTLLKFPPKVAIDYISRCYSADTLKGWYNAETRAEVRVYITRRMEQLDVPVPAIEDTPVDLFASADEGAADDESAAGKTPDSVDDDFADMSAPPSKKPGRPIGRK